MARGYIRKRGERSWQLTYDAPRGADGRRRQRYETVEGTKRQAQARLTQILESLRTDRYFEPTRMTLGEHLDLFLSNYAEINLRPRTVQGYESIIRVHLKPHLGYIPLTRLSALDIQGYYAMHLRSGLSALTVRHHHRLLHRALEVAIDWGLLERNPATRIRLPAPAKSPARMLSPDEARQLLVACRPTAYHLPIHLALYTGLRLGEVLGLCWDNVDLSGRMIAVRKTLNRVRGRGLVWGEPKSKGSQRIIAVSDVTGLLLRAAHEHSQSGQVCARDNGDLMTPDNLSHGFRSIAKRCGIQARFHDLRHTHASLLLGEGTPMHIVRSRLGHQSISTTVDIYGHVLTEADRAAGASIERAVSLDVGRMWAIEDSA